MSTLILMRHGESEWNRLNLFTGWVDVPLSVKGVDEALKAGQMIRDIPIDVIVTTPLSRARSTALLAMSQHRGGRVPVIQHPGEGRLETWAKINGAQAKANTIPVLCAWELNERMYGDLQGMNKAEMTALYGAEQVQIWRRSYDVAPPNGESLEMTAARALPYFKNQVVPYLRQGSNVFISAHGNSLRAILMDLDGLSKEQIVKLEIPTGVPILYQYDAGHFVKTSIKAH
jgi:2,3-bisphosphoglycerate-dependent phosphoglycerate mutase